MTPERLALTPFGLDNFDTLSSWIADERAQAVWSANTFPFPLTQDDMEDFLSLCHSDAPHREFLKAVDRKTGEMVGVFGLKRVDSLGHTGHLSMIMVSPDVRGTGTGSAMVKAALTRGFAVKGFRRMQLYVFDFNTAAQMCYTACGMLDEGPKKEPLVYNDERWRMEVMGIAREDYRV
jgi:RimJ/RimL family protein N-acetyltransferase